MLQQHAEYLEFLEKIGVPALLSGEYEQDQNHLRTDEGVCCLGVLTNEAIRHGYIVGSWRVVDDHDIIYYEYVNDADGAVEAGVLPNAFKKRFGCNEFGTIEPFVCDVLEIEVELDGETVVQRFGTTDANDEGIPFAKIGPALLKAVRAQVEEINDRANDA